MKTHHAFKRSRWIRLLIALPGLLSFATAATPEPLQPIGEAKGIHPGRVVWAHDPDATHWKGPGDGHWWEASHTDQVRIDRMMAGAVRSLTGAATVSAAWDQLFRHRNDALGTGRAGYRPGEKIAIKVNFVGFIVGAKSVNPDTYALHSLVDYMNTSPQMIVALLRQLVKEAGVRERDISVGDTLCYFPNEYYEIVHREFPGVQCIDVGGKFGRRLAEPSGIPIHWSSRPPDCAPDFVPNWFAEADYIVNLANLKAHTGTGVTLCAKNHFGSLIRKPTAKGYYNWHTESFSKGEKIYRPLVDFMGHRHVGGKTVLYLIDGLYAGIHPKDKEPRRWNAAPFNGDWTNSLFASQDPVAIDSVGFDFLHAEYAEARNPGVDDYLHEAALAANPPSGTFYDPDHATNEKRLASLGVHEHWNNATDRQYSRNLGKQAGIELIALPAGGVASARTGTAQ